MNDVKVDRGVWVYDVETIASVFTYVAINVDTEEIVKYVIHKDRNDLEVFLEHLTSSCKGQVGFNNISFDYPIIHDILINKRKFINSTPTYNIDRIYSNAQKIITTQRDSKFGVSIKVKEVLIHQLDLFKMWHYNNKARSTSLKALQISMNYPNVMDMPIHHSKDDVKLSDIDEILEYNLNDVLSTYEFYKRSEGKIQLRKDLMSKYGLNCLNYSDSKIGEELVLKLYCDKTGLDFWETKKLRTNRDNINLGDCIFDYIEFQSKPFQDLLIRLKSKIITKTKGAIKESVIYKGFKYDYGTGGIHGCITPGIYEANDEYDIIDDDVAALYPSIGIVNGLYPEHLGEDFYTVYKEGIVEARMRAKKAKDMVLSDGLKLAANSVYGKSNDEHSFLKDPMYTMKTTLNGQLMITMLIEEIVNSIEDIIILQVNTDGFTVKIHKSEVDKYYEIRERWQIKTKLVLEDARYSKMIIFDVNNYIGVYTNGKIKSKGRFEVDKVVGSEPAYHKDNSFRIIPLALQRYFVDNIPIEETILNHKNIYDFCGRQKFKGQDYGRTHEVCYDEEGNPYNKAVKQQKNVRYYISTGGCAFLKVYAKGSFEFIHKGYKVTIFNKFEEKEDYSIDYQFYIKECQKEIDIVEKKQTSLF
jgi:hypothetical protein